MKISDMIQSPFLKRQDFPQPIVLTIKRISLEKVANTEEKWVMFFDEKSKGLVMNKTKLTLLAAAYGDDTDHWIGKKVKLSDDPSVMYAGQPVGGIKIECSKRAAPKPAPKPAPITIDEIDPTNNEDVF